MAERNLFYEQLERESDGDYVEVVRCRDCKHRFEMEMEIKDGNTVQLGYYCKLNGHSVSETDFCAWAESITE